MFDSRKEITLLHIRILPIKFPQPYPRNFHNPLLNPLQNPPNSPFPLPLPPPQPQTIPREFNRLNPFLFQQLTKTVSQTFVVYSDQTWQKIRVLFILVFYDELVVLVNWLVFEKCTVWNNRKIKFSLILLLFPRLEDILIWQNSKYFQETLSSNFIESNLKMIWKVIENVL